MVLEQFIIDADIIWDQVGKTFFENPEAKPGRIMRVQVVNAGIIEDLTGYTLNLGWTSVRDPSKFGLDAFDDVDITKGIFEIEYTSGMLTNIGPLNASLQLVPPGQGRPIESNNFKLTVKNSAINPEAIQGETSFSTLENALVEVNGWNARIDVVEQEFKDRADALDGAYPVRLTAAEIQLNQKRDKATLLNLADLGQDIKTALTGGSVAVVGVDGTISENIVDGQVKPRNTSFINTSENLLNPSDTYIGTVNHTNGTFTPSDTGYKRTGYIKIEPNKIYKMEWFKPTQGIYFFRIAWYTSAKTFISGQQITDTQTSALVSPVNGAFAVICVQGATARMEAFFFGLSTSEFCMYGDDTISDAVTNVDASSVKFESPNLLPPSGFVLGKLMSENGNTYALSYDAIMLLSESVNVNYWQTELIQVSYGKTYSFWHQNLTAFPMLRVCFFDKNRKFIKFASSLQEFTVTNKHIKYISIGESKGYSTAGFMMLEGTTPPTKFIPYKKRINFDGDFSVRELDVYKWKDKKFCTYGDSITEYGFWQTRVKNEHLFAEHYLRGMSGSPVANHWNGYKWWVSSVTGEYYGSQDEHETAPETDAILIDGWFCADDRIDTIPTDTDIILVMGGTNDLAKGVAIGDTIYNNGYNELTFKGSIASTITKMQARIPHAQIVFMTPIFNAGQDIRPYCVAIKEVCDEFGITVIDLHAKCGINARNASIYLRDGTHNTYNVPYSGADRMSCVVIGDLKTITPIPTGIV